MLQPSYYLALDFGQPHEPTALAVIERPPTDADEPVYSLRHLQRFVPGTSYADVIAAVVQLGAEPALAEASLVVDQTAIGKALVDRLRRTVPHSVRRVVVTAGQTIIIDDDGVYHLPKKDLVTCMQLLLQGRRLKVPRSLPEADELVRELSNFRIKVVLAAEGPVDTWREGPRDDLVLAVALACWWAERHPPCDGEPFAFGGDSLVFSAPPGVFLQ